MERLIREAMNCVTYTYTDTKLSKEEMLGYIIDILNDDDITPNGILLTAPSDNTHDWSGAVTELPIIPQKEAFVETYKDAALSGVTTVFITFCQKGIYSQSFPKRIIICDPDDGACPQAVISLSPLNAFFCR